MVADQRLMGLHLAPFLLWQINLLKDIGHEFFKDRVLRFSFIDHEVDNLHNDGGIVLIDSDFELYCLVIVIFALRVPADHSDEIEL